MRKRTNLVRRKCILFIRRNIWPLRSRSVVIFVVFAFVLSYATYVLLASRAERQQLSCLGARLTIVLEEFDPLLAGEVREENPHLNKNLQSIEDVLGAQRDASNLLWLLYTVFTSQFPTAENMEEMMAKLFFESSRDVIEWLMAERQKRRWESTICAPLELVRGPFADVTFAAKHDFHTGIQRVVRSVIPRWKMAMGKQSVGDDEPIGDDGHGEKDVRGWEGKEMTLAVYQDGIWRRPSAREEDRVLRWGQKMREDNEPHDQTILIPWHTVFLIPEVPVNSLQVSMQQAIARWSGCEVGVILYDFIPYAMPESTEVGVPDFFGQYTSVIRWSTRVSTISKSVGKELESFRTTFYHQGIPGPLLRAHALPVQRVAIDAENLLKQTEEVRAHLHPSVPVVLAVSSFEPRKNHLRILKACEILWREGLSFQLVMIGGNGWKKELIEANIDVLKKKGRPIRVISRASESTLWSSYKIARFSVFVSLMEGYGLPAVESVSMGTPVVLSRHGAMKEVGDGGGALFVDPYDPNDIAHAMRRLLLDDNLLEELRVEASRYPVSTWDEYAKATWKWLFHGISSGSSLSSLDLSSSPKALLPPPSPSPAPQLAAH